MGGEQILKKDRWNQAASKEGDSWANLPNNTTICASLLNKTTIGPPLPRGACAVSTRVLKKEF